MIIFIDDLWIEINLPLLTVDFAIQITPLLGKVDIMDSFLRSLAYYLKLEGPALDANNFLNEHLIFLLTFIEHLKTWSLKFLLLIDQTLLLEQKFFIL